MREVLGVNPSRTNAMESFHSPEVISLEEFRRVTLRVGEIVGAKHIRGSTRLLMVTVDLGSERRTVVAGLGDAYAPEDLEGVRVVVAVNLAPATIRGIQSEGMLLGVGCEEPGAVALVTVNRPVPNGAAVV